MKKSFLLITLIALLFQSCTWVQPNYEGILMENYGRNGMSDFSVVTGKVSTFGFGTELIQIPMFEQRGDAVNVIITTKDGGQFTVDPAYTYKAMRGKGKEIAFSYRHLNGGSNEFLDNIENNILNIKILDMYKNIARKYTNDELISKMGVFEQEVQDSLTLRFGRAYFELVELTSGLTPPISMKAAIEAKNNAIQKALEIENKVKTAEAQAKIEVVEAETRLKVAKIDAEANKARSASLTDQILRERAIEGWISKGCPMPQAVGSSGFYNMINPK